MWNELKCTFATAKYIFLFLTHHVDSEAQWVLQVDTPSSSPTLPLQVIPPFAAPCFPLSSCRLLHVSLTMKLAEIQWDTWTSATHLSNEYGTVRQAFVFLAALCAQN